VCFQSYDRFAFNFAQDLARAVFPTRNRAIAWLSIPISCADASTRLSSAPEGPNSSSITWRATSSSLTTARSALFVSTNVSSAFAVQYFA
jgi:hypothetical protein